MQLLQVLLKAYNFWGVRKKKSPMSKAFLWWSFVLLYCHKPDPAQERQATWQGQRSWSRFTHRTAHRHWWIRTALGRAEVAPILPTISSAGRFKSSVSFYKTVEIYLWMSIPLSITVENELQLKLPHGVNKHMDKLVNSQCDHIIAHVLETSNSKGKGSRRNLLCK